MSGKRKGLKPLLPSLRADAPDEEVFRAVLDRNADEDRILNELADSMEIPEGPYREHLTLWELVRLYVPEFKAREKAGAHRKWDDRTCGLLANWVVIVMHLLGVKTKAQACGLLATACPWLRTAPGKPDGGALAKQCTARRMEAAHKAMSDAKNAGRLDQYIAETRRAWNDFRSTEERN